MSSCPIVASLILSATEVAGIHASTLLLFAWVGIPLLRFHPHPSHRRSIGQALLPEVGSLHSPSYGHGGALSTERRERGRMARSSMSVACLSESR